MSKREFGLGKIRRPASQLALAAALAAAGGIGLPAVAQTPSVSRPVVQALPSREALRLNAALSRLGRNPKDINALLDAGDAASSMGDFEAASGFYERARQISATNPRVLAGLAGAKLHDGDPVSAIPMFEAAARAGATPSSIALERGLAYDLVGNPTIAQKYYREALRAGENDEATRRLAISLAISGDVRGVEKTLLPLLRKQDKAAWRARAFSLAILGKTKNAKKITETLLPASLATSIAPYLDYMPRLTAAQQAAAANLGKFPRASEIGRDEPRIAAYARSAVNPVKVAAVDRSLVPAGKPLGASGEPSATSSAAARPAPQPDAAAQASRASLSKSRAEALKRAEPRRAAPPEPKPGRTPGSISEPRLASVTQAQSPGAIFADGSSDVAKAADAGQPETATPPTVTTAPNQRPSELLAGKELPPKGENPGESSQAAEQRLSQAGAIAQPAPTGTTPAAPKEPEPRPSELLAATDPAAKSVSGVDAQRRAETGPGFDLASLPAGSGTGDRTAENQPSFETLFGDIGKPSQQAAAAPGAVDLRKIEPAKPAPRAKPEPAKAEVKEPPAPPKHPSRIWVQLGIGQDKSALRFDWKRMQKKAPDLFKGKDAYSSQLNRTNRMLTGPFPSQRAANAFVEELGKAGFDGPYVWSSPAGQVVDAL